jgi:uncharacterized protein YlaN (UPF0358 family)
VGPRSESRFQFPKTAEPPDFAESFSHKTHASPAIGMKVFRILFTNIKTQDNACVYCHTLDKRDFSRPAAATMQAAGARRGSGAASASPSPPPGDASAEFFPKPGAFMTTLAGHAKCFACHWQDGVADRDHKPLAIQCAGCHLKEDSAAKPALASSPPSASAATGAAAGPPPRATTTPGQHRVIPAALARVPTQRAPLWPQRVATKYVHDIPEHKQRRDGTALTCISCHKPVTTAATLKELRAVESKSCGTSECHAAPPSMATRFISSIYKEMRDPKGNLTDQFNCIYCHALPARTVPPPCSHFEAVYTGVVYQGVEKEVEFKRAKLDDVKGDKKKLLDRIEREKKNFLERLVPARCQTDELKAKFGRIDRDAEKLLQRIDQDAENLLQKQK